MTESKIERDKLITIVTEKRTQNRRQGDRRRFPLRILVKYNYTYDFLKYHLK